MRSSFAILAFALHAASPALSAPLKAFDVEERAISGAGAQDAVMEEAMQALHKSTPSSPPQAREIVGALQRELTDEELQLVARATYEDAIAGLIGGGTAVGRGLAEDYALPELPPPLWLRLAGVVGLGAAVGGGITAIVHSLRTVTPPAQAREIIGTLQRELTDEELQLVARATLEDLPFIVRDVAKESKQDWLPISGLTSGGTVAGRGLAEGWKMWAGLAALFGAGAAAGGALTQTAYGRRTVTLPAEAREIFGALQRELTDEELQLVARATLEDLPFIVRDVAKESKKDWLPISGLTSGGTVAGRGLAEGWKMWAGLAALFGAGAAAGGALTQTAYGRRTVTLPTQAREIVGALQRELTDEELQLVARATSEDAIAGLIGGGTAAGRELVEEMALPLWTRLAALFGVGATVGSGITVAAHSLRTVTPQAREIVKALPANRELIEAFLAARSLKDLD